MLSRESGIKADIASELLVWVAKYMLKNKCKEIQEHQFAEIVKEYNDFYLTEASKEIYLREYIRVDLLDDKDDLIKFKYPYIYYYFTAKYLANNLSDELVKNTIEYMAQNLQEEEYGDIMIFLCHLSKEPLIFKRVLENSQKLLEESRIFDFDQYKHLKVDFDKYLDTNFRPEERKEERQDKMLEKQDEYEELMEEETEGKKEVVSEEDDEEYDYAELEQKLEVLDATHKSIEVMGQILKNYPGTIEGDIKVGLLQEVHNLGMRSLTFSYDMIKSEIKKIFMRVIKKMKKQFHKQNVAIDDALILKYIEERSLELKSLTDNLFGYTCYALLRRLSNSVGNEELKPLINHVKKDDIISFQLMKASIYLNEFGILQGEHIIQFYENLKRSKNDFAAKMLRIFVYEHYYVFGTKNIPMRQKVWDRLGFEKQKEALLKCGLPK